MKKIIGILIILAVGIGSFLAGGRYNRTSSNLSPRLNTSVRDQEEPGDTEEDFSGAPGVVRISPQKQQMIGIRIEQAEKKSVTHTLRLLGRVAPDETRLFFINATVEGWITKTLPNTTGSLVKKDETLAAFYSPEFLSAGQALLFALGSKDRARSTGIETAAQKDQIALFDINLQQYKDALRNLGMGVLQIDEMIRTRKFLENVNITSPASGFILSRKVSPGLRFEKGNELYRIADLSRVWILADVFESEAECFKPGVEATVILPYGKKSYRARVSDVLPIFDPVTRTLKVRLETDNPGFALRPDMFVDVELPVAYPPAIIIPADALLHSGFRKTVFVIRGEGLFEPREVETGRWFGNQVEILKGLFEGDRIVTSGNFLIDSESKLETAATGMQVETKTP